MPHPLRTLQASFTCAYLNNIPLVALKPADANWFSFAISSSDIFRVICLVATFSSIISSSFTNAINPPVCFRV